jgi:LysR family transcriptional regulator, nitrogen assimilation regulatory protein
MDIRQLKYFVQIVESRSLTKAAERLLISQPAIGLQIKNLEDELGVSLLVRHSRGVEPTREGEALFRSALAILGDIDRLPGIVRDCQIEASGVVQVGLAPSVSLLLSEQLMRHAASHLPKVELQLTEATSPLLRQWVADRRIDMAIGCEGETTQDVREQVVMDETLYLVSPGTGTFEEVADLPFSALAERRIVLADPMRTGLLQRKLQAAAQTAGIALSAAAVHPSIETVKLLVEDGKGETILPWSSVRRECYQGRLSAARIYAPELLRRALLLSHIGSRFSIAQREVIKLINIVLQDQETVAPPQALSGRRAISA